MRRIRRLLLRRSAGSSALSLHKTRSLLLKRVMIRKVSPVFPQMSFRILKTSAALLCCLLGNLSAMLEVNSFVDAHDLEYVRIKSLHEDRYLLHRPGAIEVTYASNPDLRHLESHWFITPSAEPGAYWIQNRLTGQSLHIENQTGTLEAAPLEAEFTSHRWRFESVSGHFNIHNAWQADQFITVENSPQQIAQTAVRKESLLSQRLVLEPIPVGATLPWRRYDETNYMSLTAPAGLIQQIYSASLDRNSPAAEAHNGGCILLNDFGAAVRWTALEGADALTLRYSILDGDSGSISLTILPAGGGTPRSQQIPLDSNQAWVYFEGGEKFNAPAPGRIPAKRFADARIVLDTAIETGDILQLSRETGDTLVWIDCLEAETRIRYNAPAGALNVREAPWNAAGDALTDDTAAIQNCINAAASQGKAVFLPAGRYNIRAKLVLPSNTRLEGAGFWETEIDFSRRGNFLDGGIRGDGSDIQMRNLYIAGAQLNRDDGYHGIQGLWAGQSMIENVWIENTTTGMWISDLTGPEHGYANGLIIRNCRIRNVFADGINLAGGTRNTVIENCHIRSAGDDALASWSSGNNRNVGMTSNNRIRYNTIECGYRAGALAVFGGEGHRIHHNLVEDQYIGAGIRGSTLFFFTSGTGSTRVGYPFGEDPIRFYENTLRRTGARGVFGGELGAIDFQSGYGDVRNIFVEDIELVETHFSAIRLNGSFVNSTPAPQFNNVHFKNIAVIDAPIGARFTGSAQGAARFEQIAYDPPDIPDFVNETQDFVVHKVGSQIEFTPTGNGTFISEAGDTDDYGVVLLRQPSGNVTVTMQPDAQVQTLPSSITFTPTNWSQTQFVVIDVVDDSVEEGLHPGFIAHTATSDDPTFTAEPLPDIIATITDNDQNQAPVITLQTPRRIALPAGVGLILEATVSDDDSPAGALVTTSWSVIEQPNGSTVTFDDATAANTGVQFDLPGSYTLELTADDSALTSKQRITIEYGATDGSALLLGSDIGAIGFPGSIEAAAGVYTIRGSGYDVWNTFDQFYFFNAPFKGDGSITIRLLSQSNTYPWAKAGLMIRDSLETTSSHALLAVTPENGMAFQNRPSEGSISFHTDVGPHSFPVWIRLERIGTAITAYRSEDGSNWVDVGTTSPAMEETDYIGVFLTSHNNAALGEATFDNLGEDVLGLAPVVSAGDDTEHRVGDVFTLAGDASDDDLPRPATLATSWIEATNSGQIIFTDKASPTSGTSANAAGNFSLRLIADDGETKSFSDRNLSIITQLTGWRKDNFGTADHPDAGGDQDPDMDGLPNLLEYAFGGNPNNSMDAGTIRPQGAFATEGSRRFFELRYRRRKHSFAGITYQVQVVSNLAADAWFAGSDRVEEIGSPTENGDGTETVRLRLKQSVDDAAQQFIRIRVERDD